MSDPIVFTIFVPDGLEESVPQVMQLGLLAIFKGTESYSVEGGTEFKLNQRGIQKIDEAKLQGLLALSAYGLQCEGQIGPRFLEMTDKEYAGLVPDTFPESSKPGSEEGTTEQMLFTEYLPFAQQSVDETSWLVQLSEVFFGSTSGDGLDWDEYQRWCAAYPGRVLSYGDGMALAQSKKYKQDEVEK